MAQQSYTLSLARLQMPFLAARQTRTVITTGSRESNPENSPSIIYMENVMPTAYGFRSVGRYREVTVATPPTVFASYIGVRTIIGDEGFSYTLLLMTGVSSTMKVVKESDTFLIDTGLNISNAAEQLTHIANVNGITYCSFGLGNTVYTYDESASVFVAVSLTAIGSGNLGITGSSGYMLAWTKDAIAWSSTIDPTDFTPSQVTGAGGGRVAEAVGDILFIAPTSFGALIYCKGNIVAATYTGNTRFPFKFRSVQNSGGNIAQTNVAYEETSDTHFALTKYGMQAINSQQAQVILPEITDFMREGKLTTYSTSAGFGEIDLDFVGSDYIKLIASRYLIISIGYTTTTPKCFIYDLILKRYGQLQFTRGVGPEPWDYAISFYEIDNTVTGGLFGLGSIGIMRADGSLVSLSWNPPSNHSSVMAFGKIQYAKDTMLTLHQIQLESEEAADATMSVLDYPSLDGKVLLDPVAPYVASTEDAKVYKGSFHTAALSHTLVIRGLFSLSTVQILYSVFSRR